MLSLFEVVTVPAVAFVKYGSFLVASNAFTIVAGFGSLTGLIFARVYSSRLANQATNTKAGETDKVKPQETLIKGITISGDKKVIGLWMIFLLIMVFQMIKSYTTMSFDGDDSFYVSQSLAAVQKGAMYVNLPYTGFSTSLDLRHALAVFPMWVAYIAKMTDIHATIVAHSYLPLFLIPFTYLIYFEIITLIFELLENGKKEVNARSNADQVTELILQKKDYFKPFFMIITALIFTFGFVSMYTNETFFLTRTWQGKSVAANVIIPMLLLGLLWAASDLNKNEVKIAPYILLALVNMAGGICSSLTLFLGAMLIGIAAFFIALNHALTNRKGRIKRFVITMIRFGLTGIPSVIYLGLYFFLR